MPTYDYQCQECGHVFEVRATIAAKAAGLMPECPECHGAATQQVFHSMTFIHRTDSGDRMATGCGPDRGPGCCG